MGGKGYGLQALSVPSVLGQILNLSSDASFLKHVPIQVLVCVIKESLLNGLEVALF